MLYLPTDEDDFDHDGLPDLAEAVFGTSLTEKDSDGDGISDGAEVDQGTDPLDGRPVTTGIIAASATPGTAVDVCAINNTAIVANLDAGVTVFNAVDGQNPIRIAQVDTPGTALAVSCSGNLIAVADGTEGLQIIDITDPPAARIVRQVGAFWLGGGSAQAVATAADLAFVGTTGGYVSMVEITTGIVLQALDLNSGPVYDLAIEGTTLYAYASGRLLVIPFSGTGMTVAGSAVSPGGPNSYYPRGRLFVGDAIAYAVQASGYNTFNVTNPTQPTLIAVGQTTQATWKQIVLNGSGLGLAAVGANAISAQNVYLHDTRNPASNDAFLTLFAPPNDARAVSIYNGFGYVADGANGLEVLNYLPYDNRGQPPGGVLTTTATNGAVTAGGLVVVHASVTDDVQVRKVNFFLNGQLLTADCNFPFETVYRVPTNALGGALNFTATISDTGGNATTVTNASILVTPDMQPPSVVINTPTNGAVAVFVDDILIDVAIIDDTGVDFSTFEIQVDGTRVPAKRAALGRWIIVAPQVLGFHALKARVRDFAGNLGESATVQFLVVKEAISRELTVIVSDPDPGALEAISREVTVVVSDPAPGAVEAISREVTLIVVDRTPGTLEAISRELSVMVSDQLPGALEGISREMTVLVQEAVAGMKESISRELTLTVTNQLAVPHAAPVGGGR